jgi:hypothetical protein
MRALRGFVRVRVRANQGTSTPSTYRRDVSKKPRRIDTSLLRAPRGLPTRREASRAESIAAGRQKPLKSSGLATNEAPKLSIHSDWATRQLRERVRGSIRAYGTPRRPRLRFSVFSPRPRPRLGIASRVEDCEYDDPVRLDPIEDGIREAGHDRTAHVCVHPDEHLRKRRRQQR